MATGIILLVTGSRSITSQAAVDEVLDAFTQPVRLLIHGGAAGVDTCAGNWAYRRGIAVRIYRPDFKRFPTTGRNWKAYLERDKAMVRAADRVIAIWDGHSSGTAYTFTFAEGLGKLEQVTVLR